MNRRGPLRQAGIIFFLAMLPSILWCQTNCEEGRSPLNPAQPQGITAEEVIGKFAAKEAIFKLARNNYTYTQDITVQTLEGNTVDGEYRQIWDVTYDDKGNRLENVTYAPADTLTRVSMSREDFADIRDRLPFVLTTEDLPSYNVLYSGQQHVDEIDTYVFELAPKEIEKGKRYFQGRVWVDNRDFQIVKTCGRNVPDIGGLNKKKKKIDASRENLSPAFVTYREQIDGVYWFPTYTRADDMLHFSNGDVHIREIIKYTKYKRFGSRTKITFEGEAPPERKPPVKKP
ncbi:MAG TPA: hypothetical protein VNW97_16655 [Candidatus Saccharimonadales bacterium]|jgi:hypothetical protein|nr:hypothetical protein [Candidatus Saccharimonadales bacterium]